jgi:hypothetical protein
MSNLSTKQRIIDVLVSNKDQWLRSDEIAELGFSEAYIKETRAMLNSKIARNMNQAITAMLDPDIGITVISKRLKRTESEIKEARRRIKGNGISELHPMKSYKIATDQDGADVMLTLIDNRKAIQSYVSKRNLIVETLKSKKLLNENAEVNLKLAEVN